VTSVIIEKGSSVLLLKRAARPLRDYWCLPGGFIRYLETPEMAAIREVKEETGLDVEINRLAGIYQIDNAPGGVSLDIIWKASVAGGLLQTNEESIEARYFEKETLPELIAYKHRQAIMEH
jgi:8-oxo-dGTP diphosphatase